MTDDARDRNERVTSDPMIETELFLFVKDRAYMSLSGRFDVSRA